MKLPAPWASRALNGLSEDWLHEGLHQQMPDGRPAHPHDVARYIVLTTIMMARERPAYIQALAEEFAGALDEWQRDAIRASFVFAVDAYPPPANPAVDSFLARLSADWDGPDAG